MNAPWIKYHSWFLLLVLYALAYCAKHYGWSVPAFFRHYLADLLCVPIVALLSRALMRLWHHQPSLQLSFGMLGFLVVQVSWVFEFWLPTRSSTFTADVWDVGCYILGAACYAYFTRRNAVHRPMAAVD